MNLATKQKKNLLLEEQPNREVRVMPAGRISDEERQALVWERRLRGMSYGGIAADLRNTFNASVLPADYNAKAVYKDIMAVMGRMRNEYSETALEMVGIELNRFDKLLDGVWDAATAGDLNAVDRVLAISRERRKMVGLDSPEKFAVDWRIQVIDLLQRGVVTPQDVITEFGEEALVSVNQLMLEQKEG